jgi:hypothetical protein
MTREDIIRMAGEAGFADGVVDIVGFEGFANFANLVAAREREEANKQFQAEINHLKEQLMRANTNDGAYKAAFLAGQMAARGGSWK